VKRATAHAASRLVAVVLALAGVAAAEEAPDPREQVVVREDCGSAIGRREVTLFANGTIRLREGPPGAERMVLGEVGTAEVAAYERRLAGEDLGETDAQEAAPDGPWVESCLLELALPERAPRRFRYGRYATHSLALRNVLAVVRELEAKAAGSVSQSRLPPHYRPQPGDVLERFDGVLFEVVAFTGDGRGVELSSPDQPITLYVPKDELRKQFSRLVRSREPEP
jgi:hypothetical protein